MRLAELVSKQKAATGRSFQAMADRASSGGYRVTRATIHALTRDQIAEWPRPETLEGLSVALDVPVADVIDATAESLGFEVKRADTDNPAVRAWVALVGDKSPDEVEHMLTAARAVAAAIEASDYTES